MKVVICGSMSASKEMVRVKEMLSNLGHNVVLPDFTEDYAQMNSLEEVLSESTRNKVEHDLIKGYYNKIKDSEAILVVNKEKKGVKGYVGGNSFLEIGFAFVLNKKIFLLNEIPDMNYKDEIEAMSPIVLNGDLKKIY